MVRHHHELCDGSGYPDGICGDGIPLTTHILIVANAFDVMTSDRSYRQARSLEDSIEELKRDSGKRYDRRAVRALAGLDRQLLGAAPAGEKAAVAEGRTSSSIWVKE
jgi:HD-GYP domain-containing protein (c-di-GMP phosphodiesterase class II)